MNSKRIICLRIYPPSLFSMCTTMKQSGLFSLSAIHSRLSFVNDRDAGRVANMAANTSWELFNWHFVFPLQFFQLFLSGLDQLSYHSPTCFFLRWPYEISCKTYPFFRKSIVNIDVSPPLSNEILSIDRQEPTYVKKLSRMFFFFISLF